MAKTAHRKIANNKTENDFARFERKLGHFFFLLILLCWNRFFSPLTFTL